MMVPLVGPGRAQGGPPCDGALSQTGLNLCTCEAWRQADAQLRLASDAAVVVARDHDEAAESTLRAAQPTWIVFRDAACEAEAEFWRGGSGEPTIRNGCREAQTMRRTEDWLGYVEQFGR